MSGDRDASSTNHRGVGAELAVWPGGAWETPLRTVPVDEGLTKAVLEIPETEPDTAAHDPEHSGEMQLPLLKFRQPALRIAVVAVGTQRREKLARFGEGLADLVRREREAGRGVLIAATTDLNHYEDQKTTERKDKIAIDRIVALDVKGLHEAVAKHGISMCGLGPTTAMINAVRALGATKAELVLHRTSGDVTGGNYDQVVGYPAIVVRPPGNRPEAIGIRQ